MASNPIVLTSNLIPDLKPNIGALANVYTNPDPVRRDPTIENEDGTFTIPTYERTVIDIPDDFDWSMYGRAGPTLRYFNRVRTGEIEYDPNNDVVDESTLTDPTDPNAPPLPSEAEQIKQALIGVGTQLVASAGVQVGRAYAAGGETASLGSAVTDYFDVDSPLELFQPRTGPTASVSASSGTNRELLSSVDRGSRSALKSSIKDGTGLENANLESRLAKLDSDADLLGEFDKPIRAKASSDKAEALRSAAGRTGTGGTGYFSGVGDRLGFGGEDGLSQAGKSNLYGSGAGGLAVFATSLATGKNARESAKAAVDFTALNFLGNAFLPGLGGPLLAGLFGGSRVICNELMRQGIMTRKQVVLDYKFTEDYLTPQHVAGYHVWAVWMVRQMRKGRLVNFWKHVAGHRANEIAYIYGDRDKPDYLGKVYRKILEPICWSIGFFCKKTDWTVLYKQKEV